MDATRRSRGDGAIRRRADGRYEGIVDLGNNGGGRRRKSVYGRTKADVRQKMRTVEHARDLNLPVPDERLRVGTLLETWLTQEVEPSERAPSTKADYRWQVEKHIAPVLGNRALAKLTPVDVQAFVNVLRDKGLGPRSVQYALGILRQALKQAEAWELVSRNVASLVTVKRPRTDPTKVYAYPVADTQRLLTAVRGDRLEGLYLVVTLLGLRRSEALGLRWSDLDLQRATLRVEQTVTRARGTGLVVNALPKTRSSRRTITLPAICVTTLRGQEVRQADERRLVGDAWQDHDLVFPSSVGTPLEPRNLTRHFHAACDRAGIQRGRFHNLRHSAASLLLAEGLPLSDGPVISDGEPNRPRSSSEPFDAWLDM